MRLTAKRVMSMQILDILEPQGNNTKKTSEIAIGIDLGTTNSLGAIFKDSKILYLGELVPSRVNCNNGQLEIDHHKNPSSAYSFKSLVGKKVLDLKPEDIQSKNVNVDGGQIQINIAGKNYTPEELSSFILKQIKVKAESILGEDVTKAVITVPAYFDDLARSATGKAAKLAGLEVLRLVNEPTAAAIAYGLDNYKEGVYAVYDFGGGTFDCTILKMQMGVFKVVTTVGNNSLGGDNIDAILINDFLACNQLPPIANPALFLHLKDQLCKIKEKLKYSDHVIQQIDYSSQSFAYEISKEKFKLLTQPILISTYRLFDQALSEAHLTYNNLQGIIMVGGSSKINFIKEYFSKLIEPEKIHDSHDPEKIVAAGAAIQAYNLANYCGKLLIDVIPLSISLEIQGGLCEKIIDKNSSIPIIVKKSFTTQEDGQSGIIFHVVQGERELAKDCRSIARFELKNITPMQAGLPIIDVEFKVDADGLLSVLATETLSSNKSEIEIRPEYGLCTQQISQMIEESYLFASQDLVQKNRIELTIKAENLIKSLRRMEREMPELFDKESNTLDNIGDLESALQNENQAQIESLYLKLIAESEKLANNYISQIMTRKMHNLSINDVRKIYLEEA